MILLVTWFSFRESCEGQGDGLNDPYMSVQLEIFCDSMILTDRYFYPSLSFDYVMREVRLCDCKNFSRLTNCMDDYAATWSLIEAAGISCPHKYK